MLGIVAEGPTHGFALAQLLAADGAVGRVWTLGRPVVYQALRRLEQDGLVRKRSRERSDRGPQRTILDVTTEGRRVVDRWLEQPVDHVRDVRSLLLLKLALLERAQRDRRVLLEAQRDLLMPRLASLEHQRADCGGFDRILVEWRLASSTATLRFIEAIGSA